MHNQWWIRSKNNNLKKRKYFFFIRQNWSEKYFKILSWNTDTTDSDEIELNDLIEQNRIICQKILDVKSFTEIFKQLCACNNPDLQFRAIYIIRNIVNVNKEFAIHIVETELMDILFAIKVGNSYIIAVVLA